MAVVAEKPLAVDLPPSKLWTRTEYNRMLTMGVMEERAPYELIEGVVVEKLPQSRKHVASCFRTAAVASRVFGSDRVQTQAPIGLDVFNEPEPDIAVLRRSVDAYMDDDPAPADVLLLVEISSSSLREDRTVKARIYARAGIADYWVLDVNERALFVHRQPGPDGYGSVATLGEEDALSPLAAPEESIAVVDMLPPRTA